MNEVKIVIPMMPPQECNPNWTGHWSKKAKVVEEFRGTARHATRLVYTPYDGVWWKKAFDQDVIMDIEVAWFGRRKEMDTDNLIAACKPARDGIADVLWGGEDKHVRVGEVRQTRGAGTVTVTLRTA